MPPDRVKQLKPREEKIARLTRMVANQAVDMEMLTEAAKENWSVPKLITSEVHTAHLSQRPSSANELRHLRDDDDGGRGSRERSQQVPQHRCFRTLKFHFRGDQSTCPWLTAQRG